MLIDPGRGFPAEQWGVTVRVGEVPANLENITRDEGFLQMSATAFLVKTDGVGDMLVTHDEVVLTPSSDSNVEAMDYLIYGWAPVFIRVLRRKFSVHASAVMIPGGSIAVMGAKGAGKSTTTLGLVRRGLPLIIDDILPVDFTDEGAVVHGWARPLHLRDSAADFFQVSREHTLVTPTETKVQLNLPSHPHSLPLRFLVELQPDPLVDSITVTRLSGVQSLRACMRNTNSTGIAGVDGRGKAFFEWVTTLSQAVPIYQLTRPEDGWSLDEVLDSLQQLVADHTLIELVQ
ncbi:MAG: hypothetical protein ACOYNJ_05490 [Candidatus Nanopelagicales bacterium]